MVYDATYSLFYHGGLKNVRFKFFESVISENNLEIMKTGWSPGQS